MMEVGWVGGIQTLYSTMHLVPFIVCMYVCMHVYLYVCYYLVFIYLFPRRPAPSITLPTAPPCAGAAPPQGSYTHPNPPPPPHWARRQINLRIFRLWWQQRERGSVTL